MKTFSSLLAQTMASIGILFMILIALTLGCPTSRDDYSPCDCTTNKTENGAIQLHCSNKNLTDSRVSAILRAFISVPGKAKRMEELNFAHNRLSKVPVEMRHVRHPRIIDLSHNKIRSVPSGTFKLLSNHSTRISLDSNRISTIEPRAFRGTFGLGSSLCLMDNRLTRFEANVFKPFLEQVIVNYNTTTSDLGFVDIFMNEIDCLNDPCHLAWLIRDNRRLLKAVWDAECSKQSKRKLFKQLDQSFFNQTCPPTSSTTSKKKFLYRSQEG